MLSVGPDQVFVHPHNIAHLTYSNAAHFTTPAHQDFVLIQGTRVTYTVWLPLTDFPIGLGGLTKSAGTHKFGILPARAALGAGGFGIDTSILDYAWHASDLAAGDILFFHSFTVHKALPNRSGNCFRFSTDTRYQGVSLSIVENGLLSHFNRLFWDEIYQGWTRRDLPYYWQRLPIKPVPCDPSLREKVLDAGKM